MKSVAAPPRLPRTFAALQYPNYRLFFFGMLVSSAGTWMQIIAQGWLVYEISQSEWMLGVVGFASAIPALLVSPWGGVLVDRLPRRNILIATQSIAMTLAFILAGLVLSGVVEVWHVVLLAALTGAVNAIDAPARQAMMPDLIPDREHMANGIALNSMVFNGARVTGPAMGGFLLVTVGAGWCFLLNGFSFLAVILSLILMKFSLVRPVKSSESPLAQVKRGAAYIASDRTILGIVMLAASMSLFGVSFATVLPAYVDKALHQGESAFAMLTAAQGVGAIVGAIVLATYGDRLPRGMVVTTANFYFPVALMALAFTSDYPLALLLMFILGIGFISQFNQLNVLLQLHVDNTMRGRVMALYTLTFFGISPVGNLLMGTLSESWGLTPALAASAAAAFACAFAIHRHVPQIRSL